MRSSCIAYGLAITALLASPAAGTSDQAITETLGRSVQPCWLPPQNAVGEAVVRFQISPDGELSVPPKLEKEHGSTGGTLAASALRAVQACAPYPSVGELIGNEPISIRATFSLTGFSAVRGEQAYRPDRESVAISVGADIVLNVLLPDGLCYIDPAGGGLQAKYMEWVNDTLIGNHAHAIFLDCATVREIAAGVDDFTLPEHTMELSSPYGPSGDMQRFPERSLAQAVAFYERLFTEQGAPGSALDERVKVSEAHLREGWDVDLSSERQVVLATDERAAYTSFSTTIKTELGTFRQISVAAYSQVFDLPITLGLYAPADEGNLKALLDQAKRVIAGLHANSVQKLRKN
ncbi:TonB C-terminal domain-containing protein [Aureimonas altamirensis]|uniref:energy transducer TonB n=1 Tax=Aureimonas altamirensis TaxID=370622 RepID=UPI001E3E2D0E|nr:TonB C-terminal domain-containing protein [Aureimonas altamirensis]UHD45891.1 TonB C-terminal domain-containing protein [Aureimonas altamirensis]